MKSITKIVLLLSGLTCGLASAQERHNSERYKQLKAADSLLFERGFNHCDFAALEKLVHADLQFLHDQGGMQNREQFFKAIRENICGGHGKPTRKLLGNPTVYPLYDNGKLYGAIQMGDHEFYNSEDGRTVHKTSVAKFIHTWLLENGQWRLYRVLSYDHKPAH